MSSIVGHAEWADLARYETGEALAVAIAESVPDGAPVLRCTPYGWEPGFGPGRFGLECLLPITAPAGPCDESLAELGLGAGARAEVLSLLTADEAPHSGAAARAAIATLEPGAHFTEVLEREQRPIDGVPSGVFSAWTVAARRGSAGRVGQRKTSASRRVLAAVAHDLLERPTHELGERLLGMHPGGDSRTGKVRDEIDSRAWNRGNGSPYTYWRDGRTILAALGAWPWAHFSAGKLPRTWRRQQLCADELISWFDAHGVARS